MRTTPKITNENGKKVISFRTEVEIEEYVDVDVRLNLDEVIDDIIDEMTEEHFQELSKRFRKSMAVKDMAGDDLKRHLCNIVNLGYQATKDEIFNKLNDLI